ncbi:sigma-54-dependent transcriptional regulator [Chondrinema litorale]|uniref:sigma-54-dependent transcriptional regulator n=1 Tax=Chondrinema litorale TaxID=2994555 RepID=UPI002543994E|nr:sigma-54 dependent transcriptional regulator [Chondrinema litorale]UZR94655.1 sigma-54 dependent transcriptional regulator [Chondrinema litorale]
MGKKVNKAGKILIVDDNEDVLKAAKLYLKRHFLQVDVEKDPENIPDLLNNESYDVILLDMNFTKDVSSGHEGFYWLDKILEIDPSAVVVLITAYGGVETAVRAIKEGATDFVLKPWENEKLLATLSSAIKLRESRMELNQLKDKHKQLNTDINSKFQDIIGQSSSMIKIFETIELVAKTDANVLILGENGTGKELIARALHRQSARADEIFMSVDLGAVSEPLFESELFGHVKGAFTDAREERAGRFETASGGTIFLDEIGNLSLPLQAKLLTVLQSRTVTRVGSNKPKAIDIRLICATNMHLYEMVKDNRFRQDLLYRINTIEINLPPLRERIEDIPLLAEHFLSFYVKKYGKHVRSISPSLIKRMQKYHWPGNIRELQHAMERAVIMSQGPVLDADQFFFSGTTLQKQQDKGSEELNLENYDLEKVEKILIRKVLQKHNGNISKAANELGLTRSSLYRRLEKYEL